MVVTLTLVPNCVSLCHCVHVQMYFRVRVRANVPEGVWCPKNAHRTDGLDDGRTERLMNGYSQTYIELRFYLWGCTHFAIKISQKEFKENWQLFLAMPIVNSGWRSLFKKGKCVSVTTDCPCPEIPFKWSLSLRTMARDMPLSLTEVREHLHEVWLDLTIISSKGHII